VIFLKIIFLDIDGVLNGYNRWNTLGWKIICKLNCKKLRKWYANITDPCGIHKSKVKRLAKIIKDTDAKVVLSSSWRYSLWKRPYEEMTDRQKKFIDACRKYNIEIIDITPSLPQCKRDQEILEWLSKHEEEVESFIILDDENTHLTLFDDDEKFIQTSSVPKGVMICGYDHEDTGLKDKHVKEAIRVLNKSIREV
jgi:hypothetical protein